MPRGDLVTWARGRRGRIIRREDLLAFLLREQEVWSRGEGGEGGQVGCSYDGPCCAAQLAGDVLVQQVGGGQGGRVGGCWGHEEGCAGGLRGDGVSSIQEVLVSVVREGFRHSVRGGRGRSL